MSSTSRSRGINTEALTVCSVSKQGLCEGFDACDMMQTYAGEGGGGGAVTEKGLIYQTQIDRVIRESCTTMVCHLAFGLGRNLLAAVGG